MNPIKTISAGLFLIFSFSSITTANSIISELSESFLTQSFLQSLASSRYLTILNELSENEAVLNQSVSPQCAGAVSEWLLQFGRYLSNGTTPDLWALHMLDAFGKIPDGILSGHINNFGDYDECVEIRSKDVIYSEPTRDQYTDLPNAFTGQYCTVYLVPLPPPSNDSAPGGTRGSSVTPSEILELIALNEGIPFLPSSGMCFPSSCSIYDVGNLTQNALEVIGLGSIIAAAPGYCATDSKPDLDAADISVMVLLGGFVGLCFFAGTIDMWLQKRGKNPGLAMQYLLAFSLYTNIRKWLSTRLSPDDFGCIHGIRFLSTTWVVLGHTWYMILFVPAWNMVEVKGAHSDLSLLTVLNGTVAVDTFFVMAGMLVTYNFLKILDKTQGSANIPLLYLHRYLRLTPTYAILIGVMATLLPYLGSGPYWFIMDRWSTWCEKNWWTNLLYVNNFVDTYKMCQGETWFLACDLQFYILSPLFIYPLWRWPKVGLSILAVMIPASIACPLLIIYYAEVMAPTTTPFRDNGDYFRDVYIMPHTRIQTYLIGIALGYFLHVKKGQKVRLPKAVVAIGWGSAAGAALGILYGIRPWFDPSVEIPVVAGSLYGGFHRVIWALCVSWVIFACIKGYGGLVNAFLSWKPFMPLGRLSFCVYLVSLHLQMILHLNFRQNISYDVYTMTNFFMGHLVMSYLVGFICTLVFESPFILLEKLIFEGGVKHLSRSDTDDLPRPSVRYGIFYQKDQTAIDTNSVTDKHL